MSILKAVATIGGYTGLSRVFGLVREILMSHFLGASLLADAFIIAFKFPNFFRRFFAEGAFNAAFIPTFAGELAEKGRESAKKIAEDVFSSMAVFLLIFSLVIVIATPWLLWILAPGFAITPERSELVTDFIRITFPYIFFISLTALMGSILNSLDKFASTAATPILLNIVMISSMLLAHYMHWNMGYSLSVGIFVAGVFQLGWLYFACARHDFRLEIRMPKLTPKVRHILKLMGPGTIGAGVMQVNIFLDLFLASFLPTGAVSYLYYADRLNQLPLSIFGVAISTALLPLLSKQIRMNDLSHAKGTTDQALKVAMQLTLPASIGLVVLAHPVISLIYGHGKFDEMAINATAPTLAAFAVGLPAYVVSKVLSTCFFARQDTSTPVRIALISVASNLLFNLVFIWKLGHIGLALSTAFSAWINAAGLAYVMYKKGWYTLWERQLIIFAVKVSLACLAMAGFLKMLQLQIILPEETLKQALMIVSFMFAGGGVFLITSHFLGITSLLSFLRRRGNKA